MPKRKYTDAQRKELGLNSRKNKKVLGEPTKKKKRSWFQADDDFEEEYEEYEEHEYHKEINIEASLTELVILALEKYDWEVSEMVTFLAAQMQMVVREYE